jgi:hypothetical protein
MALMTSSEVISTAFNRTVATTQIKASDIEAAEWEYIRPILTENLYNEVIANTSTYSTLISTYIKPCLAYYTKSLIINDFMVDMSDRGLNQLQNTDAQPASGQLRSDLKEDTIKKAKILADKLLDYVQQRYFTGDTLYVKYKDYSNVYSEKQLVCGMLVQSRPQITKKEDEPYY